MAAPFVDNTFSFQNAAAAIGNGNVLDLSGYDPATLLISITGTFVGTVTFEHSMDGGTTWLGLPMVPFAAGALPGTSVATATTTGQFYLGPAVSPPLFQVRMRVSAYTSGAITVVGRANRFKR